MYQVLKSDTYIMVLFPMFFASNWFYTYQFNGVNLAFFNIRTRSLNNLLYWTAQIFGAIIFGTALDFPKVRRSVRAKAVTIVLFMLIMGIWGGGYAFQTRYTRASVATSEAETMDWTDPGYVGPLFLYIFYGFFDAAWQTTSYW